METPPPPCEGRGSAGSVRPGTAPGESAHDLGQLQRLHGLGKVDLVSGGEHARGVVTGGESREGRGRDLAPALGSERADLADEGVAVLARHPDVAHEDVRLLPLQRLYRFSDRSEG